MPRVPLTTTVRAMKSLVRLSSFPVRAIQRVSNQTTGSSTFIFQHLSSSSSSFFSTTATTASDSTSEVERASESVSDLEKEYEKEIDDILRGYEYRAERKQALVGKIVSTKSLKTINVLVGHDKYIQKYDKHIRRHKKIMAHDEDHIGEMGDLVRIVPCRPRSRRKRHILKDIIRKAPKLDFSNV